jgi:AcrR family transcriptional regulator
VEAEPGLRERKKRQTRQAISAAAFDLFAERGFDAVAVSEVARRAGVSEATVFNYFRTKEDLVYGRLEDYEADMLRAVSGRGPGQSVLAAFRAYLLTPGGLLAAADPEAARRLATLTRIITGSRALRSRERQIQDGYTDALALHIAAETSAGPNDIRPWVVANALTGVHRALLALVRARVLAGDGGPRLAGRARAQAGRAFDLLDHGLAGYPARPDA